MSGIIYRYHDFPLIMKLCLSSSLLPDEGSVVTITPNALRIACWELYLYLASYESKEVNRLDDVFRDGVRKKVWGKSKKVKRKNNKPRIDIKECR